MIQSDHEPDPNKMAMPKNPICPDCKNKLVLTKINKVWRCKGCYEMFDRNYFNKTLIDGIIDNKINPPNEESNKENQYNDQGIIFIEKV